MEKEEGTGKMYFDFIEEGCYIIRFDFFILQTIRDLLSAL